MLATLLSLAFFASPVQEKVHANEKPSITGAVQDEKGQAVPGATVIVFMWKNSRREGGVKTYL